MSLVENWKDRVPTEVLPNGAIRYEQFDSSGNSLGYVYIKRADEPTEVGNIWDKVTYDGIKDEFSRTILQVNQALDNKLVTRSYDIEVPVSTDLSSQIDMDSYINSNTIILEFESYINKFALTSSWTRWLLTSSDPMFCTKVNDSTNPSGILYDTNFNLAESQYKSYIKLLFYVKSKTFELLRAGGSYNSEITSMSKFFGRYINNIGSIQPRRVETLSSNDFIKIKAYDSAEISSL